MWWKGDCLMISWEQLVPNCSTLCNEWARSKVAEHIFDGSAWSAVEHVVHELAHGVLLGLDVNKNLSDTISEALTHTADSLRHERDAWVIEVIVCEELGLPIEDGDAIDGGEIQGVDEWDMRQALGRKEDFIPLANKVLSQLEQLMIRKAHNEGRHRHRLQHMGIKDGQEV